MSLSKVLEKIKETKPLAEEDVTTGAPETLNTRRGRKARAVEEMKTLKKEYSSDLLSTAAFILVIGEKRDAFSTLAVENFKCFTNDPNSFYSDLANRIPPSLYLGKEGVSNVFDVLGRHLEDKALELDIVGYPQLIFTQKYRRAINSREEFTALVREAVNDQVGGELVGIQAVRSIVDEAIAREHSAKFTPIILPTSDEKFALTVAEALERITKRVFVISTGKMSKTVKAYGDVIAVKEPDQESVQAALSTISGQLKR